MKNTDWDYYDWLKTIYLDGQTCSYIYTAGAILALSILVYFGSLSLDIGFSVERSSQLLLSLATAQITTLVIVFAVTVMSIQYSANYLPGEVSQYYLKTPIFKITLGGTLLFTVSSFITFGVLEALPESALRLILSLTLTSGMMVFIFFLIYILLIPELISVRGILRYYAIKEPDREKIDNIYTVVRDSVEKHERGVAKQAIYALESIVEILVSKTEEHPYGNQLSLLDHLLVLRIPDVVQRTTENNIRELHSDYCSVYVKTLKCGSQSGRLKIVNIVQKGLERILYSGRQGDKGENILFEYLGVYNAFSASLSEDGKGAVSVKYLNRIVNKQHYLYKNMDSIIFDNDNYTYTLQKIFRTYENVYRHIIFNYDSEPLLPPNEKVVVRTAAESSEDDLEEMQNALLSSINLVHEQLSDTDESEEKIIGEIPSVLSTICTTALHNWELKHALPMVGLYVETFYLFSESNISGTNTWTNNLEQILPYIQSNLNDDEDALDEIHRRYSDDRQNKQFFDFDEIEGLSNEEFNNWMSVLLTS